jgi:hypothetical protein
MHMSTRSTAVLGILFILLVCPYKLRGYRFVCVESTGWFVGIHSLIGYCFNLPLLREDCNLSDYVESP